jgi:fumarate reductase flavoprotein subunit
MKKMISVAAVSLAVAMALVGCGSSASSSVAASSEAASAVASEATSEAASEQTTGVEGEQFTATAPSDIGGEVSVTITVADGAIVAAEVDVSSQTAGLGADHQADYEEMIVAANGAELDNISGCTVTTDAIKTAYADTLAQAGLN